MSTQRRPYELKVRAERREDTRRRIIDSTVALHREVGPAKTTVTEIARRAGVSRLTVYQHFPDEAELFSVCQSRFFELNPRPDFRLLLALKDPFERLRKVLLTTYESYSRTAPMTEKIQRDRHAIPSLNALMERTGDAAQAATADALTKGFVLRGKSAKRARALIRLALDFWTWKRLQAEGLDAREAADVMSELVNTLVKRH